MIAVLLVIVVFCVFVLWIPAAKKHKDESGGDDGGGGGTTATYSSTAVPAAYRGFIATAGSLCPEAPPQLIAAQIETESGWRKDIVSPMGAIGLSQFMPDTWKTFGGGKDPTDPEAAITAQAKYDCAVVRDVEKMKAGTFGTCTRRDGATRPGPKAGEVTESTQKLMLASYNAGPGAVCYYRGIPPYRETKGYVKKITDLMETKYQGTVVSAVYHTSNNNTMAGRALNIAMNIAKNTKTPYVWGGGTPSGKSGYGGADLQDESKEGYDCSGLVLYAYYQASGKKLTLPRTAAEQGRYGREVTRGTGRVDESKLVPGDVITFARPGEEAHHIAIYSGPGMTVNAFSSKVAYPYIRTDPFSSFSKGDIWVGVHFTDPGATAAA
ncbi:NlpC/P60 family protein [Embleya sp. NBC_00896]|uniref:NlpC/P60 family protein n=1 Tax=Embleya sp. NBC_00896 TaxID=2975961 RepID=UPI00386E18DF|nr:NlpC/P60 family protein [Embleya sp. NBC_00896]